MVGLPYRDNWWIFGEPRRGLRPMLANLPRYIATVETAKHRAFQFLDAAIAPTKMAGPQKLMRQEAA